MQGIGVVDLIRRDFGPFGDGPILHKKSPTTFPFSSSIFHRFFIYLLVPFF